MAIRMKNADGDTEKRRMPMTFAAMESGKKVLATMTLNDIIGENIRRFRKSQRMTQQKLARAIYGNQDMVCNWELGKHAPSAYYLIRLADAFGCSVDEILGRK